METIVEKTVSSLPTKHQFGKLITATIAGFAATKLAEKGYEAAYTAIQQRKLVIKK